MPVHSAQELVHEYRFDMHTLHNSLEFVAMPYISIFKSFHLSQTSTTRKRQILPWLLAIDIYDLPAALPVSSAPYRCTEACPLEYNGAEKNQMSILEYHKLVKPLLTLRTAQIDTQ